jgi:hypothetical protein
MTVGPWGGFSNGRIPASLLRPVTQSGPPMLARADAAAFFDALAAAFFAEFGHELRVNEAFRSYDRQVYLRTGYLNREPGFNIAAVAGYSIHGWALAFDVNVYSFASAEYKWLKANAGRFGFDNVRGSYDREPWHWEFSNVLPSISLAAARELAAFDNSTPAAPTPEEVPPVLIRIQAEGRGIALIGPGYYRILLSAEEVEASEVLITKHLTGNARQFDLWRSLALAGVPSAPTLDVAAIASAVSKVEGLTDAQIAEIADAVNDDADARARARLDV